MYKPLFLTKENLQKVKLSEISEKLENFSVEALGFKIYKVPTEL